MEKFTTKNLRSIAKRNNIRGYSKLPKSELIAYLRTNFPRRVQEEIMDRTTSPEDIPRTRSLLDDDILELSQQPLQPIAYIPHFQHHHRGEEDSEKNLEDGLTGCYDLFLNL